MTSLSKFFRSRLFKFDEGDEDVKKEVNEFEVVEGNGTDGKRLPPADDAMISVAVLEEDDEDEDETVGGGVEPVISCIILSEDEGGVLAEDNIVAPTF